jgi:hypothetical protein
MGKRRRKALWFIGGVGGVIVLALILIVLWAKVFINLEGFKEDLFGYFSKKTGVHVHSRNLEVFFFPRPGLFMDRVGLSIPGKAGAVVKSVTLYPRILPLFRGKLRAAVLELEAPAVRVPLPQEGSGRGKNAGSVSPEAVKENVFRILSVLSTHEPALVVRVVKGEVALGRGENPLFWFRGINGLINLPPVKSRADPAGSSPTGGNTLIHLETQVGAELSPDTLVPLRRLVKDAAFRHQIDLIEGLQGHAEGKLILQGRLNYLKVTANFFRLSLAARYVPVKYPIKIEGGHISYSNFTKTMAVADLNGSVGRSSFSQVSGTLNFIEEPYLDISSCVSSIFLEETDPWLGPARKTSGPLKGIDSATGNLRLRVEELNGPLFHPGKWHFRITGDLEAVAVHSSLFPAPVRVGTGKLTADPRVFSISHSRIEFMDASLLSSLTINGYLKDLRSVSLKTRGDMGTEALQWVWGLGRIPQDMSLRAPAAISSAHLIWKKDPSEIVLSAGLTADNGPQVALDMHVLPEMVQIKDLRIQDEKSHAVVDLTLNKEELSFAFAGNLEKATIDKLLAKNRFLGGWVKGNIKVLLRKKEPTRSVVLGKLSAARIGCPCISEEPVEIEGLSLTGTKQGVRLESAAFTWEESRMSLQGDLRSSSGTFLLDMALSADRIRWREVEEIISAKRAKKRKARPPVFWTVPLQGSLRINAGRFDYHGLAWGPLKADLSLGPKEITVVVTEADLCGISTPANVGVFPEEVTLDMTGSAKDEKLDDALTCLGERERLITGDFTFDAELTARGKPEDLVDSLGGHGDFLSTNGRIYRFPLLARIFALLNVSEIFRGRLPDLAEGFGYKTLKIKAKVLKGTLSIEEATLDGSSMDIACEGNMDLVSRKIDFTILVAPFKTIDSLIQHLPVLGYIFQGRLVSVPVKVAGEWSDPVVTPLAPSAVGSELLGLMERTLLFPYQIIQPLVQGKSKP